MFVKVSFDDFVKRFKDFDRDNFSMEGMRALFDYLEELEDETSPIELDVIALCCDYTEYADLDEVLSNYDSVKDMDDLRDHTTVIEFDGGLIIQNF